ncbi:hypothetical protein K438DRAFT_1773365 [Mycena galopus ATCC 62051]|nr:hypothetical protein K438DRAFT_1773365 [Mycena galopus ATCC 62051]
MTARQVEKEDDADVDRMQLRGWGGHYAELDTGARQTLCSSGQLWPGLFSPAQGSSVHASFRKAGAQSHHRSVSEFQGKILSLSQRVSPLAYIIKYYLNTIFGDGNQVLPVANTQEMNLSQTWHLKSWTELDKAGHSSLFLCCCPLALFLLLPHGHKKFIRIIGELVHLACDATAGEFREELVVRGELAIESLQEVLACVELIVFAAGLEYNADIWNGKEREGRIVPRIFQTRWMKNSKLARSCHSGLM